MAIFLPLAWSYANSNSSHQGILVSLGIQPLCAVLLALGEGATVHLLSQMTLPLTSPLACRSVTKPFWFSLQLWLRWGKLAMSSQQVPSKRLPCFLSWFPAKCPGTGLASSHRSLIHVSSAAHLRLNPFYSLSNFLCKTTSVSSLRFRSWKPFPFVLCIRSKLLGWLSHSQQSPPPPPPYQYVPSHPSVVGYTITSHFLAFIPGFFHPPLSLKSPTHPVSPLNHPSLINRPTSPLPRSCSSYIIVLTLLNYYNYLLSRPFKRAGTVSSMRILILLVHSVVPHRNKVNNSIIF